LPPNAEMYSNNPVDFEIIPLSAAHRSWVREFITTRWGAPEIVVHDERFLPETLPGCLAIIAAVPAGLITWNIIGDTCEIISLDSLQPHRGIGSAFLAAAETAARSADCKTCCLVTTNDNIPAQRFYTNRGYFISHIDLGAVNRARILKPAIPFVNGEGVPITDEITFVKTL